MKINSNEAGIQMCPALQSNGNKRQIQLCEAWAQKTASLLSLCVIGSHFYAHINM